MTGGSATPHAIMGRSTSPCTRQPSRVSARLSPAGTTEARDSPDDGRAARPTLMIDKPPLEINNKTAILHAVYPSYVVRHRERNVRRIPA